eukprot:m51a1_g3940 hypothetical protein (1282) ;mRNA; r:259067-265186
MAQQTPGGTEPAAPPADRYVDHFVVVTVDPTAIEVSTPPTSPVGLMPPPSSPPPPSSSSSPSPLAWPFQKPLKPFVSHVYPEDAPGSGASPVPPHLPMLCFPRGAWLDSRPLRPLYFTFSTTETDGSRQYAGALLMYEESEARAKNSPLLDPCRCYAPTCLCVLSRHPLFASFKEVLVCLYKMAKGGANVQIERWISCFVDSAPLPPPGSTVVLNSPLGGRIAVSRPTQLELPQLDFPVKTLFDCIGVSSVVTLFDCMLQEAKIIFSSRQLSLLNAVSEIATSFMYPFKWTHIYIPVLCNALQDFLCAPMTFMVGVPRSSLGPISLPREAVEAPDVLLVDLDGGRVRKGSKIKQIIPDSLRTWLVDSLGRVLMRYNDPALPFDDPMNWADFGPEGAPKEASHDVQIRSVFLDFFLTVLKPLRKHLQYVRKYPHPVVTCYNPSLVKSQPDHLAAFLDRFTRSQPFVYYLESFAFRTPTAFDQAIYNAYHTPETRLDFLVMQPTNKQDALCTEIPCPKPTEEGEHFRRKFFLKKEYFPAAPAASASPVMSIPLDEQLVGFRWDETSTARKKEEEMLESRLIDECIADIFSAKTLTPDKQMLFSGILDMPHGGLSVTQRLTKYILEKREVRLKDTAYQWTSSLIKRILWDATETHDFRAPAELLKILGLCYHLVSDMPEFLYAATIGCELWKNLDFWEFAHFQQLQHKRSTLPKNFRTTEDDYALMSADEQKKALGTEETVLFDVLSNTARHMLSVGLPESQVTVFVSRLASIAGIPQESVTTLVQLTANLGKIHKSTSGMIEVALKSSSSPDSTPSPSFTVRRAGPVDPKQIYAQLMERAEQLGRESNFAATKTRSQSDVAWTDPQAKQLDCGSDTGKAEFVYVWGKTAVCAFGSGLVTSWDIAGATPKISSRRKAHAGAITGMRAFGQSMATGSADCTVRTWEVGHCGELSEQQQLSGCTSPVLCVGYRAGVVLAGTESGEVVVWSDKSDTPTGTLKKHTGPVRATQLFFIGSAARLVAVSGSDDRTSIVWDPKTLECLRTLQTDSPVRQLAASGWVYLSVEEEGLLSAWDLSSDSSTAQRFTSKGGLICRLLYHHESGRVYCGTLSGTIEVWEALGWKPVGRVQTNGESVTCMAISENGRSLAAGTTDGSVFVFDTKALACAKHVRGLHESSVSAVCVLEGSILSGSDDGKVFLQPLRDTQPAEMPALQLPGVPSRVSFSSMSRPSLAPLLIPRSATGTNLLLKILGSGIGPICTDLILFSSATCDQMSGSDEIVVQICSR